MYSTGHAKEGATPPGMTTDSSPDLFDRRRSDPAARHGEPLHAIRERLPLLVHYQAVVGVLGKAGVGKSALCNALSGQECAEVSDVDVCTRHPLEITLSYRGGNGLSLLDVPGMGESTAHDKDYAELYRRLLPELDLILWVIKGDDRALSVDEQVYRDIVRPYAERHHVPVMIAISQIDKIEPSQEWDWPHHHPGPQQAANVQSKRRSVCRLLAVPPAQVCMVSARAGYGLVDLVEAMVSALPTEKRKHATRRPSFSNPAGFLSGVACTAPCRHRGACLTDACKGQPGMRSNSDLNPEKEWL